MNIYEFYNKPEILKGYEDRNKLVPLLVYQIAKKYYVTNSKMEKIIGKSATTSVLFAEKILKGPFKKGETIIATSARTALKYSRDIIKTRFIAGEKAIATNIMTSVQYATSVLSDRFLDAEELIFKNYKHNNGDEHQELYLKQYFTVCNKEDETLRQAIIKYNYKNSKHILEILDNTTPKIKPPLKKRTLKDKIKHTLNILKLRLRFTMFRFIPTLKDFR